MLTKTKQFDLKAVEGVEITPDMLAKINGYAMKTLTAEDVYVRKYLMAHNGVDRDRERFPETILDDFVNTLAGKSFLEVHDKSALPLGRFFDSFSEEMSKAQFKALTGEEIILPKGMETVKVVYGLIYLVKADFNDKLIANIEAGIYSHASIGFSASDLVDVKNDDGQLLYREYVSPGEAREGSIVWLGAQPGATAQKAADGVSKIDCDGDWEDARKNPLVPMWSKENADDDISPEEGIEEELVFIKEAKINNKIKETISLLTPEGGEHKCPFIKYKEVALVPRLELKCSRRTKREDEAADTISPDAEPLCPLAEYRPEINGDDDISREELKCVLGINLEKVSGWQGIKKMCETLFHDKENERKEDSVGPGDTESVGRESVRREYRDKLEKEFVTIKTILGDVSYGKNSQITAKKVASGYPLDLLIDEVRVLEKRLSERHNPSQAKLKDKLNADDDISPDDAGWKDRTKNPLIPKTV